MPIRNAEAKVIQVCEKTQKACDVSVPLRNVFKKRMPKFWGSSEIEERRKVLTPGNNQRSKNRLESEELRNG